MHNIAAINNLIESYQSFVALEISQQRSDLPFCCFYTSNSEWPSLNFTVPSYPFNHNHLKALSTKIKEVGLSRILIIGDDQLSEENLNLLKDNRFMPVAQWVNMYKGISKSVVDENASITRLISHDKVQDWKGIVNQVLFPQIGISDDVLRSLIDSKIYKLYVTYEEDLPVSTCMVYTGTTAGIYMVATAHGFQRKGFAKQMLQQVHQDIVSMGYDGVYLHSTKAGLPLYQNLGYQSFNKLTLFYSYG